MTITASSNALLHVMTRLTAGRLGHLRSPSGNLMHVPLWAGPGGRSLGEMPADEYVDRADVLTAECVHLELVQSPV